VTRSASNRWCNSNLNGFWLTRVMAKGSRYQSRQRDEELCQRLVQLAPEKPHVDYRRQVLLPRSGEVVNHKLGQRVY
jgi:hypothetical protein